MHKKRNYIIYFIVHCNKVLSRISAYGTVTYILYNCLLFTPLEKRNMRTRNFICVRNKLDGLLNKHSKNLVETQLSINPFNFSLTLVLAIFKDTLVPLTAMQ